MSISSSDDIAIRHNIYKVAVADLEDLILNCPHYDTLSQFIYEHHIIQVINNISPDAVPKNWDEWLAAPAPTRVQHTWETCKRLLDPDTDYAYLVDLLEAAKNRFPKLAWAKCLYARSLWSLDKYHEAVHELLIATQQQPSLALGLSLLGETYYLKGQYDASLVVLNKAIALTAPPMARTVSCRAYTQKYLADDNTKGSRELRILWYECAIRDFETAIRLTPERKRMYLQEITEIRLLLSML